MTDDPTPNAIPDADLPMVKTYWAALVRLGRAVLALGEARDLIVMASGNVMPGASLHLLHEMAAGLMRETGELIVNTGRVSTDAEVKVYVALLQDRLAHEPPVTVPPSDEPSS